MLPHGPSPTQPPRRVGVGIDTSRYGHVAAFLRDDLQFAADDLQFVESAAGYAQLRQRLEHTEQRYGPCRFAVRLDAAGQYADNLIAFLHGLATPVDQTAPAAFNLALSCGDPQRNKNYRAAVFDNKKSDPIEARAAAIAGAAQGSPGRHPGEAILLKHTARACRLVAESVARYAECNFRYVSRPQYRVTCERSPIAIRK